ncbi:MAG: 4-hydroxy-3-methylbut-2-enyl diphosphate reductase [Spirochaetales bacterium]|nr:4-hydroxy-3-methylbut-2-enyl diphosphate reductase [Spirochaetales bacterium]
MEIIYSEKLGYCPGVRNAVSQANNIAEQAAAEGKRAYCIGRLVHNNAVVQAMGRMGMEFIDEPDGHVPGTALISAHGIPDSLRDRFVRAGFTLIDGTCPRIIENRNKILQQARMGRLIVIIGIPGHSEVRCLEGTDLFPGVPVSSVVVGSKQDIAKIPDGFPLAVAAQTTVDRDLFDSLVELIKERFPDVTVLKTICPEPLQRQAALRHLCERCPAVVIVGGLHSANTTVLAEVARRNGCRAYVCERSGELPEEVFSHPVLGIASGASTPFAQVSAVAKDLSEHV